LLEADFIASFEGNRSRGKESHELLTDPTRPNTPANANLAFPFLISTTLSSNVVLNKFYNEIRDFFRFDDSFCGQVPDPDESVFVRINLVFVVIPSSPGIRLILFEHYFLFFH
jgi:hypothetical protein